jgi:hypothetical protein
MRARIILKEQTFGVNFRPWPFCRKCNFDIRRRVLVECAVILAFNEFCLVFFILVQAEY